MSTPDSAAIQNFQDSYKKAASSFNSSEFLYFSDYNQGSYTSGIVKFDTLTAKDQFWIPADSYVMIPISVQAAAGGTALTASDPVAFKNSVLDLITGITINSGSGQTLVNEQNIHYINNIRRLLDTSYDAMLSNTQELQLFKNTVLPPSASAGDASVSRWTADATPGRYGAATNQNSEFVGTGGPPITQITTRTQTYNSGFDQRIRMFKTSSTFATGVFSLTCFIPLSVIHPLFANMDYPVVNTRFQINLYTATTSQNLTLNCPVLRGLNAAGTALSPIQVTVASTCYIYYRKVTYSAEDTAKVGQMISSGHKIVCEFPSYDYYGSIATGVAPNATRTDLVSPSTVAPLRVWQLALPAGYFSGSLGDTLQTTPFQTNSLISRGNILINSQRYYSNDLGANLTNSFLHDFYTIFQEQTQALGFADQLGSLVGYSDFINHYNLNCYDVSRLKDRLPNPSEAVNIQVQYTLADGNGSVTNNSDILYLVERNTVLIMVFSSGSVSMAIGSAAN